MRMGNVSRFRDFFLIKNDLEAFRNHGNIVYLNIDRIFTENKYK